MITENYLDSVKKQFLYYKTIGEKALKQVPEHKFTWQYNAESNSIAAIVKHLSGNMLSRWTNFLTTDGEKEWRNRDAEFENDLTAAQVMEAWHKGWDCFLHALQSLSPDDLEKIIYIRNEGHTVMEAINRQLAHYPYHIGQIIFIAKLHSQEWDSLSIPRNKSGDFNTEKFAQEKQRKHFTDDSLGI